MPTYTDYYKNFINVSFLNEMNAYGRKPSVMIDTPDAPRKNVTAFKTLDKGCLLYQEGEKYPSRANIPMDKVVNITLSKKLIPHVLRSFKGNIFKKVIALLYFKDNWELYLDYLQWHMIDVYPDNPDRYNQPTREFYRILSRGTIWDKIRDVLCAIIEYDMAYRYRAQDIVPLLDKEKFYRNPVKEMRRLMDIMIKRDSDKQMKNKYSQIKFLLWFLRFRPMLLEELKDIVKDLNLEEIKPSTEDLYWMFSPPYEAYDFQGLTFQERNTRYILQKYGK